VASVCVCCPIVCFQKDSNIYQQLHTQHARGFYTLNFTKQIIKAQQEKKMQTKKLTSLRTLKYSLFRYLPGQKGLHYQRQFRRTKWADVDKDFQVAAERCRDRGLAAVDLGANVGEFTCRLSDFASTVYAFEPDPWAFSELKKRTEHISNVVLFPAAAGDQDGTVKLFRHPKHRENRLLSSVSSICEDSRIVKKDSEAVDIPKIDFVKWLKQIDEQIGILKIDIEGAEVELLEALLWSDEVNRCEYIFCETHEPEFPHLLDRYKGLKKRASALTNTKINFDWH
jgi:FkbM family methyltransferase